MIHNASEILLRNFLNVNNQRDAFDSSVPYPTLLDKVYSLNNKFGALRGEFQKNNLLRNKLDHIGSGLIVEDPIITFYEGWVIRSINVLFKASMKEIKKNVKPIEQPFEYMCLEIGKKPLLPNPLNDLMKEVCLFPLVFTLKNDRRESGTAQVHVHSPCKALSVALDVPKKTRLPWFRKKKTREYGDAEKREQYVGPRGAAHFLFNFRLNLRGGGALRQALTMGYVPIDVNASIKLRDGIGGKIGPVRYELFFEKIERSPVKKKND